DRAAEQIVAREVWAGRVGRVDVAGLRGRKFPPDARLVGAEVRTAGMIVDVVRPCRSADVARSEERRATDRQPWHVRAGLAAQAGEEGIDRGHFGGNPWGSWRRRAA